MLTGYFNHLASPKADISPECEAIARLRSTESLQDLEIYDFLSHVASQSDPDKICVLHSGFFTHEKFEHFLLDISRPAAVRSGYRKRLLDAELILCPIWVRDHWYLMGISKSPDDNHIDIRCLDGFNDREDIHKVLLEVGKRMIEGLYGTKVLDFDLRSTMLDVTQTQDNGYDCGAVISYWGARFCDPDLFKKYDNLSYFSFRKVMIDVLLPLWQFKVDESSSHHTESYPERRSTPTRVCG